MTPRAQRPHDVIVFGATSFVGQILCRYLVERHGLDGELNWAIAGRNAEKLENVAADTGAKVTRIVADAGNADDVASLVDSCRVVISTVGPYALYGSELVAAAAAAGTDYCDLAGEVPWMQRMIDAHGDEAERTGARIVHSCGFDSIPSDLGVWFTQQAALERFGEPCARVAMRVKGSRGGVSGGTVASMMNMMAEMAVDPSLRDTLANHYALAPAGMRSGVDQLDGVRPRKDEVTGEWVAPFVMAGINTRVVHRSHALLGHPWGEDFRYDEAVLTGAGPLGAAKAAAMAAGTGGFAGLTALGPTRRLLGRVMPKPGSGPSEQSQEAGCFDLRFHGTTAAGGTITTNVTGDRDPGYGSTAKMLGESAVVLLRRSRGEKTGVPGGFWTPSTAMGADLIDALRAHAGLTFEVV